MDIKYLGLSEDLVEAAKSIGEASCKDKMKEELVGGQKKLDVNKNGKLDADDFKKLREEETVEEAIGVDAVDKNVKLKRAGAKPLGLVDKIKGIGQGFAAARKGESEDELKLYNKSKSTVKEEAEQIEEGAVSPTAGTRKVASYGDHSHTAEVRYNPEYQEYQVHHYKDGKHQGEGPVSYHYDDKEDAHNTAKHSVGKTNEEVELTLEDYSLEEIEEFMMSEDYEQLDEISKATLNSYKDKAQKDVVKNMSDYADKHVYHGMDGSKELKRATKRSVGIHSADDRLKKQYPPAYTKEEVEELDEYLIESEKKLAKLVSDIEKRKGLLDIATEKRRMRKGSARHFQSPAEMNHASKIRELTQKHDDLKKSMSEDFEQLDEISKATLGSYVKKAANDTRDKALDTGIEMQNRDTVRSAVQKFNKSANRVKGIAKAVDKLTKEQVEEIEALAAKHGLAESFDILDEATKVPAEHKFGHGADDTAKSNSGYYQYQKKPNNKAEQDNLHKKSLHDVVKDVTKNVEGKVTTKHVGSEDHYGPWHGSISSGNTNQTTHTHHIMNKGHHIGTVKVTVPFTEDERGNKDDTHTTKEFHRHITLHKAGDELTHQIENTNDSYKLHNIAHGNPNVTHEHMKQIYAKNKEAVPFKHRIEMSGNHKHISDHGNKVPNKTDFQYGSNKTLAKAHKEVADSVFGKNNHTSVKNKDGTITTEVSHTKHIGHGSQSSMHSRDFTLTSGKNSKGEHVHHLGSHTEVYD